MKFQIITDYALRIILCMAQREDKVLPVKEAADAMGIICPMQNSAVFSRRKSGLTKKRLDELDGLIVHSQKT